MSVSIRTRTFAVSIILHCLILVSFFVEIVTPMSLDPGTAGAITLALVATMGWAKGFFSKQVDELAYWAGAVGSGVLFTATILWIKWGIDNPVQDPPRLGHYLGDVLRKDPLWVVLPMIAVSVAAYAGVLVGRRFHERRLE